MALSRALGNRLQSNYRKEKREISLINSDNYKTVMKS